MRILFFLPQTRHTPAFEWGLNLIQRHLDGGDEVSILTCFAGAASCEINLTHRYSVCDKCIAKRRDGFAAIGGEWNNRLYADQLDGLCILRASLEKLPSNIKFYLRNVDSPLTRGLRALDHPSLIVVPPESPVGSYALMKACDTVLTYGSTMGIEAVFHSKPSILAGKSFYQDLGGTYNPRSRDEFLELLKHPLPPKSIEAALRYGYFYETYGYPFKYFIADAYHAGTFKGRRLNYGKLRDYFWGAFDKLPWLPKALNRRLLKRSLKGIQGAANR